MLFSLDELLGVVERSRRSLNHSTFSNPAPVTAAITMSFVGGLAGRVFFLGGAIRLADSTPKVGRAANALCLPLAAPVANVWVSRQVGR